MINVSLDDTEQFKKFHNLKSFLVTNPLFKDSFDIVFISCLLLFFFSESFQNKYGNHGSMNCFLIKSF